MTILIHAGFAPGGLNDTAVLGPHRSTDAESRFDLEPAPRWVEDAACRGLPAEIADRFFFGAGKTPPAALGMCNSCAVQVECKDFGAGEEFGVWGGENMTGRARRQGEYRTKLTDEQVVAIRSRVAGGELHRVLAAEFGVAIPTITRVGNGTLRADAR